MSIDELIFLSNVALAIVTAGTIWATLREGHRHEERETKQLAGIVHEVMEQERHTEDVLCNCPACKQAAAATRA